MKPHRKPLVLFGFALAILALPGTARAQSTVTCSSSDGGRHYCGQYNRNDVRLSRQLTPAQAEGAVEFMQQLAAGANEFEFSAGESKVKKSSINWFKDFVARLPKQTADLTRAQGDHDVTTRASDFSAVPGYRVDGEQLGVGSGNSKKGAEQEAAREVLADGWPEDEEEAWLAVPAADRAPFGRQFPGLVEELR